MGSHWGRKEQGGRGRSLDGEDGGVEYKAASTL